MPQPPPEIHSPTYLNSLTAIIAGLVTVVLGLVGFITNWFKKTQEGQQDQLDEGVTEFTGLKLRVQHLEDDIKSLRKWTTALEQDLDIALKEIATLHDFQIRVCIHHKKQHDEEI